jgi:dihydroorotate dehydrogenase
VSFYRLIRPLVFSLDPERAHHLAIRAAAAAGSLASARALIASRWSAPADPRLAQTIAGIRFPNPVGLGAGWDKSGQAINALSRIGFGFLEVGSVSRYSSEGNPIRPRVFRLPGDEAVIVNYGVPNDGAEIVAPRIAHADSPVPVGINLVETNTGRQAEPDDVIEELASAAAMFAPIASFLAISAECANAPGIHPMARIDNLRRLLEKIAVAASGPLPPVIIKLRVPATDIEGVLRAIDPFPFVRGFRINTIAPRPYHGLATPKAVWENAKGSLSSPAVGYPAMLRAVCDWYIRADPSRYALIASGGIRTGNDAYLAMRAGASLVQCVTALIFEGPGLARRINEQLIEILTTHGIPNISNVIGTLSRSESLVAR